MSGHYVAVEVNFPTWFRRNLISELGDSVPILSIYMGSMYMYLK